MINYNIYRRELKASIQYLLHPLNICIQLSITGHCFIDTSFNYTESTMLYNLKFFEIEDYDIEINREIIDTLFKGRILEQL